jgi:formate dehydrogenase alpha subunit
MAAGARGGGAVSGERSVRSVCPYCAVGCGLLVEARDGVVWRVRGDPSHPANRGRLCAKGALLPGTLRTPDRLLVPQARSSRDQPFRRATWDEALALVAGRFRAIIAEDGPDAVAFYGSGQLPTEDYYLLGKLAKGFIGTNNQDTNSRLCMASASAAYAAAFGVDGPPCSYDDVEAADCFLILGANVEACHPVLFQRLQARKRARPRKVRVIVVDPRRTRTAELADLHLPIRPGTDVALLNAFLHELALEGLVDRAFIEAHTEGWQAVRETVRRYPPERVAALCGVDAEAIRAAALLYGRARAALSLWAMGANQSVAGVDKNLALINLALATGNLGRPGAGPFSLTGQPNAMGGREVGGLAHTLPGHRLVANPAHRAEMERFWRVPPGRISSRPGLTAVELFRAVGEGRVRALWIIGTNPAASMPDAGRVARALERAELVVVQDAYHPTETTRFAHVLLPAAQWSERTGTMTNGERRICLLEQAVPPPGEALPDWQILCRFAREMGFGEAFAYRDVEEIFEELKETTRGRDLDFTGVTYVRLREEGGVRWPFPQGAHADTPVLYGDGRFPTPSGRARFVPVEQRPPAEPADAAYPLVLTTGRVKDQWHTRTRTGKEPKLVKACPEPYVELHPDDAARLGVRAGRLVEVRSRRGALRLPARITRAVRPGVVFVPFHWGALWSPETAVNEATIDACDPVSGEPELKHCAVHVRPLRE